MEQQQKILTFWDHLEELRHVLFRIAVAVVFLMLVVTHKTAVKSCKSKKTLNLGDRRWCRPVLNGFNLAAIHLNALRSNHITKKQDMLRAKCALFHVTKQHANVLNAPL